MLILAGADINKTDKRGWTPFLVACQFRNFKIVSMLMQHGAVIDNAGNDGKTPLHWACRNKRTKIIPMLIQAGANVFIKTDEFKTDDMVELIKNAQYKVFEAFLLMSLDAERAKMFFDKSHFDANVIGVVASFLKN